ncbi:MAG: hypothetical protein IT379_22740, partial [Deltaproteobacteria bacterium]|nr:hypothetical protein [Deltaproteobacteria bacterium]
TLVAALAWLSAACGTESSPPVASSTTPLGDSAGAFSAMSSASRDVVANAPVRFLLLPRPWARDVIATSGPRWSALSVRDGELTLSLHGTDATHHVLDPHETRRAQPRHTVRGVPARVTVNEGIRSVAWSERGVHWALEVECFHNATDTRCTEEAFILDVAARLEEPPAHPPRAPQPEGATR